MAAKVSREYRGALTVPGETEPRQASVTLDVEEGGATIRFDEPAAGANEWTGGSVRVIRRLKYYEVTFVTTGLPKETIELDWRCNVSLDGVMAAGVVTVRPNELKVSGEKGFSLD